MVQTEHLFLDTDLDQAEQNCDIFSDCSSPSVQLFSELDMVRYDYITVLQSNFPNTPEKKNWVQSKPPECVYHCSTFFRIESIHQLTGSSKSDQKKWHNIHWICNLIIFIHLCSEQTIWFERIWFWPLIGSNFCIFGSRNPVHRFRKPGSQFHRFPDFSMLF